jgi:NADH-quinone oxidoreductase subunit K
MLIQILPLILFITSLFGLLVGRKNIIMMIICLELMLLSIVFHYLMIGWCHFGDYRSIILGILVLTVGASESAIGLALSISYFKNIK